MQYPLAIKSKDSRNVNSQFVRLPDVRNRVFKKKKELYLSTSFYKNIIRLQEKEHSRMQAIKVSESLDAVIPYKDNFFLGVIINL